MTEIPKTLNYKLAAQMLGVHEKTILRRLKIPNASVTPDVRVEAVTKAFHLEKEFLGEALQGRDRAVDIVTAAEHLGFGFDRRHVLRRGMFTPVAHWKGATRYSAKRLGMMAEVQS